MPSRDAITILHLSDLQFGKNHRFAGVDLTGLENPYDTLLARLWGDLQGLRNDHGLRPDVLVVTGDLAEWGMPDEFRDAREFLERLTDKDHLNLARSHVAIIPGNHDVNRKASHSYFLQCESDGTSIVAPWWPKWRHYAAMFSEFYRDVPGATFTQDQPWTLFEVSDLRVVIAGLNSTMVEGHDCQKPGEKPDPELPRHLGLCGEPQYRWFEDHLARHHEEGWLRIGAVHHNQQRKCRDDEENLEDADLLHRVLGPRMNLLLHGHTHEARLGWLDPHSPILSTGSAALRTEARPAEMPNQYQVLQISDSTLRRFGRSFLPESKTFGPDPRVGKNDGLQEERVRFAQVSGAFFGGDTAEEVTVARPRVGEKAGDEFEAVGRDSFLSRVAEVCRFRKPAATSTPVVQREHHVRYLRVIERTDAIVRQYPVGVFEHGFTREDLDRFLAVVDAPYRAGDSGLISEIVYSGERPAEDVIREAERRRIRVMGFGEYQGLIDFTPYVERQNKRLEQDEIYPPRLYVQQRMRFHIGQDESHADDALAQVEEWLVQPHPRFVLILGDFGTGKTFLLHELARRMGRDGTGLVPLFVELRALEKAQTLDALVAQHLAKSGVDRIDLPAFRYMLQQGRIVLFFDGFDELALRVSYERAAEHFDTLIQAAAGDAKVVVTSRTQHFESDKQVRTVLYERAQPLPGLRYCKLQPFTENQIKRFLVNRWGSQKEADHWFDLLAHVKDLLGLSENPRMLGFITELKKEDIARAKQKEGVISAADLYRLLLERWLVFEYERAHPKGAQVILSKKARWAAVTAVALRLWEKTEKFVSSAEIAEATSAAVAKVMTVPPPVDIAGHLIGSGSLLRRDDEGCFFFVHQSVMEWLVAREAAREIQETGWSSLVGARALSPLMAEFLCDLATPSGARGWAVHVLEEVKAGSSMAKTNALEVLQRLGGQAVLNLAGQDLRGKDFAEQSLAGADLSGADLSDARLVGRNLTGARLDGARLVRADLTRAVLTGASLRKADLSQARLLGADLRGARLEGAVLRRAVLIGAQIDAMQLDPENTVGAALPGAEKAVTPSWLGAASACNAVAWNRDGELAASGHADGTVRIWNASRGKLLRTLEGHKAGVWSVSFDPSGRMLASGSDDNTVKLWEASSGKLVRTLEGHKAGIISVSFDPSGRALASGSDDNTVRLWEASSGKLIRTLEGHKDGVTSVSFDPSGRALASGSDDNTVKLWEVSSGKLLRTLEGHKDWVRSVCFDPSGGTLASGSDDNTVKLWEVGNGKLIRTLEGHKDWVRSVCFDASGGTLASGSDDNTIKLWEASSSKLIRTLEGHKDSVLSVCFDASGGTLASGSDDNTVKLWEASSGKLIRTLEGHKDSVLSVCFDASGGTLASGSSDNTVTLWHASGGRLVRTLKGHKDRVWSVCCDPLGRTLASGCDGNMVKLWDASNGKLIRTLKGHKYSVWSVCFDPSGGTLASGSDDNTVKLWEVGSGKLIRTLEGHKDSVLSVCFDPSGRTLASGSNDNTVKLWEANSGKLIRTLQGHQSSVSSVCFDPSGWTLASGSNDNTVKLWEASSGKLICTLEGHKESVWSVCFGPPGGTLASGSSDNTIRLWEAGSGKLVCTLEGHQSRVWSVCFDPSGGTLASGSDDGTIRLWRVQTGEHLATLLPLPEGWAVFTPEGRYDCGGNVAGGFWHVIGLCRFEVGELDEFIPGLRMKADEGLFASGG